MASFTDQIPQFSPYISRAPIIEAMGNVGMYKQAKYDEGVQKIQSYVDNVAGLDVYNPISKKYLESKVNELSGRLRTVAAGDFSNQQLVNSIGGMAGEIIKDPNIQNAVYSASNIKNQTKAIESAKANGEWGVENEDLFNDQLAKYYNSTDLKDRFSNAYVPYIDLNKRLKEIADLVGVKGQTIQQLYQTDSNGDPIPEYVKNPKTGKIEFKGYKWNDLAVTETFKGKEASELLSAFKTSLTPADYQQLAITGRYMYKNYNGQEVADLATSEYSDQLSKLDRKIDEQRLYLINAENAAKPDTQDITTHSKMYALLNDQKEAILKNKNIIQDSILKGNLDVVKGSVYADRYLTDMSTRMASVETSSKSDLSPLYTINKDNKEFAYKMGQDRIDNYYKALESNRADKRLLLDESKEMREAQGFALKYGLDNKGNPINNILPTELDFEDQDIVNRVNSQVESKYESYVDATNQSAMGIAKEYFKALPGNKDLTDQQLTVKLANTLKKYNAPLVPGEENKILTDFALKGLALYKKNKNKVAFEDRGAFEKFDELLQTTTNMRTGLSAIDNRAKEIAKEQGLDVESIADVSKVAKGFDLTLHSNGFVNTPVKLSKEDALNVATLVAQNRGTRYLWFDTDEENRQQAKAEAKLVSKYGREKTNAILHMAYNYKTPVDGIISAVNQSQNKAFGKIKAGLYRDNSFIDQGQRVPIFMDESNKEAVGNKVSTVLNQYKDIIPGGEDVANKLIEDVTGNKFKANINVIPTGNFGETKYELEVNGVAIPISADNYPFLTNQQAPKANVVPPFVTMLDVNGTSNLTGKPNKTIGNVFGDSKFMNYKDPRYTLTGDYVTDKDNKNLYWFKIYKHDTFGEEDTKIIPYDQPIPKLVNGHINPILNTLPLGFTTDIIKQIEPK